MLLRIVRETLTDASVTWEATLTGNPPAGEEGDYDDAFIGVEVYNHRRPDLDIEEIRSVARDGGEVTGVAYRNVTESAIVWLREDTSTVEEVVTKIDQLITAILTRAESKIGDRYWLEWRPRSSMTKIYSSQLLTLTGESSSEIIDRYVTTGDMVMNLSWTREFDWKDKYAGDPSGNSGQYALTEIELANGSVGSPQTGGVNVENHDDGDANDDNWVQILASDLEGTLPFQPLVRIDHQEASGQTRRIYVAHRDFLNATDSSAFDQILEGEDNSVFSTNADAGASDGNYGSVSWTGSSVVEGYWTLDTDALESAGSESYRILGFFFDDGVGANDPTSEMESQMTIRVSGTSAQDILQSPWSRFQDLNNLDMFIQELGVIRIPPYLQDNISDLASLRLYARFRNLQDTGSHTVNLDFVQLSRVPRFRRLVPRNSSVNMSGTNSTVFDDHRSNETYLDTGAGTKLGGWLNYGDPFAMRPDRTHRVYFLVTSNPEADIDRTHRIRMFYEPRYLFPTD